MKTVYMYALGESGGTEGAFKKAIVWAWKESLRCGMLSTVRCSQRKFIGSVQTSNKI